MPDHTDTDLLGKLSKELDLPAGKIGAVVELLGGGNTVPFIARYRKEATGALDEVQIRAIQERHAYLVELEDRRRAILKSIDDQGKLSDSLRLALASAGTKSELEDLYLPFKPKRRTRATIARERGLAALAARIYAQPADGHPRKEAQAFVDPDKDVPDANAALAGARDILAEQIAERADVRALARSTFADRGRLTVKVRAKKKKERTKFEQYYDYSEAVGTIPSHRFLAVLRGEREEVLRVKVAVDHERLSERILRMIGHRPRSPHAGELHQAAQDAFGRLIAPSVERDVRAQLKERSDRTAVDVFASNLGNLLMAPPLGTRSVVGIDPGLRTGCKCAAVDATGAYRGKLTIHLAGSKHDQDRARNQLLAFLDHHRPAAVAVGNGTGGRETERFVRSLLTAKDQDDPVVVQVNEAGASVYSASELAREELPDLDVTIRGAVSIGRRLQDPLAELVKIDPGSIGVGQYQHDVNAGLLSRKLDEVVESCVNQVGVELNTASAPLLARVAGLGPALADKIVSFRDEHGAYRSRQQLLKVPKLGKRTFEQAAGFLRVSDGDHPLDASAVHPERYRLVERIASDLGVELVDLVGDAQLAGRIDTGRYLSEQVGALTLADIVSELQKPGRDPRKQFEAPRFRDDVNSIEDLSEGMQLEGVVTNVTNFGAFVDLGVHRDGLVHVSQLAERFIKDPHEVVSVGDRLRVRVLEVDQERKRISLSAIGVAGGS